MSSKTKLDEDGNIVTAGKGPEGVIYVDQDSDITSVASKVRAETAKNVKIVVPKGSSAFRSGVNLKLLQRTAHTKSKTLALITSDPKLKAMAASAKIPVAANLSAVPALAAIKTSQLPDDMGSDSDKFSELDEDLTITGEPPVSSKKANKDEVPAKAGAAAALSSKLKGTKANKGEKTKRIPNFEGFRKKAIIGIGVLLALMLIFFLVLNSKKTAVLELRANAQRVDINSIAALNPEAEETTAEELKVIKRSGSQSKTETVPATGQQNIGSKATGKITITNCTDNNVTISAGTGVASGGKNYLTASTVTVPASDFFSPGAGGACKRNGTRDVNISASAAGEEYNIGTSNFSVAGVSSSISGRGSASGGTTQIVKVATATDIQTLKDKFTTVSQDEFKSELSSQGSSSERLLDGTFTVAVDGLTTTPQVNQQAEQVTGTATINYSVFFANEDELKKFLDLQVESSKESDEQTVIKNGFEDLKLEPAESGKYTFITTAYLGPNINQDEVKSSVAGKKKGEAIEYARGLEGINDAKVKISPFWGSSLPGAEKIEIKIEVDESSSN